jgi:hypothetical protein
MAFFRLSNEPDILFQNQHWAIICNLCTERTITEFCEMRSVCLNRIQDMESVHIFHVWMFDLLCKFVTFRPADFSATEKMVLVASVIDLMSRFANNTNLMQALFRLVRGMVRSGQFVMFAMPCLFPMMIIESQSLTRSAAAASALAFLVDVQDSRGKSKCVDQYLRGSRQFGAFEQGFLKGYLAHRRESYGGFVMSLLKRRSSRTQKHPGSDTKRILSDFIAN